MAFALVIILPTGTKDCGYRKKQVKNDCSSSKNLFRGLKVIFISKIGVSVDQGIFTFSEINFNLFLRNCFYISFLSKQRDTTYRYILMVNPLPLHKNKGYSIQCKLTWWIEEWKKKKVFPNKRNRPRIQKSSRITNTQKHFIFTNNALIGTKNR